MKPKTPQDLAMATWRDLTTAQDELHRPASIVSLLLDTAEVPVHVGSISDDQRFCAAGCDRDVRTTAGVCGGLRDLSIQSLQSWLNS